MVLGWSWTLVLGLTAHWAARGEGPVGRPRAPPSGRAVGTAAGAAAGAAGLLRAGPAGAPSPAEVVSRPPAQGQTEEAEVCVEPPELEEIGHFSETGYAPDEGGNMSPSQAPPKGQPAPGREPTPPEDEDSEEDPSLDFESEPTVEPWEACLQALARFWHALTSRAGPWCPGQGPEAHGRRRRVGIPGKEGEGDPFEDAPPDALDALFHALGCALIYLMGSANWALLSYLVQYILAISLAGIVLWILDLFTVGIYGLFLDLAYGKGPLRREGRPHPSQDPELAWGGPATGSPTTNTFYQNVIRGRGGRNCHGRNSLAQVRALTIESEL